MNGIPETFPITHDDYHAEYIGRTSDGRQFFLATPFNPPFGDYPGGEYIALYTFDGDGQLLDAIIDALGPRDTFDEEAAAKLHAQRLASLGDVEFCNIRIAPFKIERFGIDFGLIPCEAEDEDDEAVIEMHPGNYMEFYSPWEGDYDT